MQKYNYNHERVCEKRKCRKNVGKGKPPPTPPTGGGICEIGGILGGLGGLGGLGMLGGLGALGIPNHNS